MRLISQPGTTAIESTRRRGGVRGTRAASGSPATDKRVDQHVEIASFGDELLLDANDVARRLKIGRTKTYQLILRGAIPVVRIGRSVRVPAMALARWIEANVTPAVEQ